MKRPAARIASALLLVALLCITACHSGTPTLSLLVWEGYADPSFIHAFELSHHCRINAAYMGSSDDLVAKLRGGAASNYDVISPSSDVAASLTRSGLVSPLDLTRIPHYAELSDQLRTIALVHQDGKTFGVPLTWGPNPLLYDTTAFSQPPQTWASLWDPGFKRQISLWDDLSSVFMAAQVLGYDKPDRNAIYNLSDAQLAAVQQKLIALKPKVRKLWTSGGELTNLFQNHEIVAAMGWPLMTNQLRALNFPIAETIPSEGTTGWIDHLMITAQCKNPGLAYAFLDYMIQAQTQKALADVTGYDPANPSATSLMTPAQRTSLHLDNVEQYQKQITFWQDVPRRARYTEVWNQVKAAE